MKKPKKVTTIEQAIALPMAPPEVELYIDERGYTVRVRKPEKFYPRPCDGDQILFFTNGLGQLMEVIYGEDGPMQRPYPA